MSCSCKNKQTLIAENKKQYQFSATTQPLNNCLYCAQKHVGTANALIKDTRRVSKIEAAGELLLASYHIIYDKALAKSLKQAAIEVLINPSDVDFDDLLTRITKDQTSKEGTNTIQVPQEPTFNQAVLHIAAAYQLLLEPYYQHINKSYAVGQLCLAAIIINKTEKHKQLITQLRQTWKILQQTKLINDVQYKEAKKRLQNILNTLSYIIQEK